VEYYLHGLVCENPLRNTLMASKLILNRKKAVSLSFILTESRFAIPSEAPSEQIPLSLA
jgi:hypothetical protein